MTIEGAPHLRDEHYAVFDCANRCGKTGKRFLAPMAHVQMMAATQPFLSGAISKTVNLPNDATVEDVAEDLRGGLAARAQGRRALPRRLQGLAAAVVERRREGRARTRRQRPSAETLRAPSRSLAPMPPTAAATPQLTLADRAAARGLHGQRVRLPKKRRGFTQEARVGGHKIFLRTGEYEDGTLGEIFIDMHKEGAAFRSLMNCFAMSVLDRPPVRRAARDVRRAVHVHALRAAGHRRGAPEREVRDVDRRLPLPRRSASSTCTATTSRTSSRRSSASPLDAAQHLGTPPEPPSLRQLPRHARTRATAAAAHAAKRRARTRGDERRRCAHARRRRRRARGSPLDAQLDTMMGDAPVCDVCGHITVRNGACYKCLNCGNSMGCS